MPFPTEIVVRGLGVLLSALLPLVTSSNDSLHLQRDPAGDAVETVVPNSDSSARHVCLTEPPGSAPGGLVWLRTCELGRRFLLQGSYVQKREERQEFTTSRSRIVRFVRRGSTVQMIEDASDPDAAYQPLATVPIRKETAEALLLDVNAGFDRVFEDEDRTGEDYYGGEDPREAPSFPIDGRQIVRIRSMGPLQLIEQRAHRGDTLVRVHYYLSPYRPSATFRPFELDDLNRFGFYQTYPQRLAGRMVFYATKFDIAHPIVFALSAHIPASRRSAVRDGVRYWNRVLGRELIQIVDAPQGAGVPDPAFNVIEWMEEGVHASTSHIQEDPLTGEILHAYIFLDAHAIDRIDPKRQDDLLRYITAHEIGHALGLRHNFAKGPPATVMNYFDTDALPALGNQIRTARDGLPYDRQVMRHVYLGAPLNTARLPGFCTDDQPGCGPLFRVAGAGPRR